MTVVVLLVAACGREETAKEPAAEPADRGTRPETVQRRERSHAELGDRAERCEGAVRVRDGANDTRSWTSPAPPGRHVTPPSGDLRLFELRADDEGLCVRWTTRAPIPEGTELVLGVHGPPLKQPSGAIIWHGYGFSLRVTPDGGVASYGLDRSGSRAPRILRARVGRSGRTVSAFVARSELDRPPANMPQRPPFPYRAFTFEARVITAPGGEGGQSVDFAPAEGARRTRVVEGRLCPAPCPRLKDSI